jgi:hypothetical protein
MISESKIETMLELFKVFNKIDNDDEFHIQKIPYNDKYFRWTNSTFKHGCKYTVLSMDTKLHVFNTLNLRSRLAANSNSIQHDTNKVNFACKINIVEDLLYICYITGSEEPTDDRLLFNTAKQRAEEELRQQKLNQYK